MHSACTGIVIKNDLCGTSFLTSASLVRSFDDGSKIMPLLSVSLLCYLISITCLCCDITINI
jgi:hypothetical protein